MNEPSPRPDPALDAALAVAVRTALDAGRLVQAARGRLQGLAVTHKAPGDVASAIDREAEAFIRERLLQAFPDHAVLGEEGGGTLEDGAGPTWIVDPIDGSANYLRGYPQYAVALALVERGEVLAGVVHDPCRGETFSARRDGGLLLDGRPLQRSDAGGRGSLAATVFPKPASPRMDAYLGELARVMRHYGGVRRSGAMTLELAYLAAGRVDAFWAQDMGAWDVAAGIALLREAGADIVARDGAGLLRSRSLAAAGPGQLAMLLGLLEAREPVA